MWALNAKQIILQVATTLCKLQQLLVVIKGAVKVWHDRTGDVCTSCLKYVQDFKWSSLTVPPRMDDERGTCAGVGNEVREGTQAMQLLMSLIIHISRQLVSPTSLPVSFWAMAAACSDLRSVSTKGQEQPISPIIPHLTSPPSTPLTTSPTMTSAICTQYITCTNTNRLP